MNKRVLRTLINEQGLWEDEMLPTFQTITILVHLGDFALSQPCRAGSWSWSLGDWDFFFQPPYRHDMGKLVRRWPSLASTPQLAFPWAVCPGVRRLWRVSGRLTGRRGQGGLSGSCYLPGGVEVLVSSESAGSHR